MPKEIEIIRGNNIYIATIPRRVHLIDKPLKNLMN